MHESDKYFNWLLDFVCNAESKQNYKKLFFHLFNTEFTCIMRMDFNRVEDGLYLRVRYENETENKILYSDKPCSVLEMMIALAIRCENDIMSDMDYGDRTGEWFWVMIENLDLLSMNNDNYNDDYVDYIITRLINREYDFDGTGGLFKIMNFEGNMQNIEIWYQMQFYLNTLLERSS